MKANCCDGLIRGHSGWEDPEIREMWGLFGLPESFGPEDILTLLDDGGDGTVSYEEFPGK